MGWSNFIDQKKRFFFQIFVNFIPREDDIHQFLWNGSKPVLINTSSAFVICVTGTYSYDHLIVRLTITQRSGKISDTKSVDVLYRPMSGQATLSPLNIEQTLEQILASQEITLNHQRWLISLCFEGSLTPQQEYLVNQVYEGLRNRSLLVVEAKDR